MLFDTHAHYDDSWFDADRDALLQSMQEHNVGLILNPGCDVETSKTAVRLAHRHRPILMVLLARCKLQAPMQMWISFLPAAVL